MLQICFGTYLMLGLPAMLLLWMALAAAKRQDTDGTFDSQSQYRIVLAIANLKNSLSRTK